MPEVELTGTLAIGSVTENLRPYFEEFLTTQNIKIIDANVTFSYQNSLRLICEHILPACERMQLELSKLMGYSLWTQRYGDFLETDSVQSSIDHFSDLIARLHEFASDLNHLATTFQAFIKWITMITIKVSDDDSSVEAQNESSLCEDPELVLEFLNKDFIKDSLSEYFVPQTPKKANVETLSDLLTKAKESYYKMLKKPSDTLSEQIVVTSKVFFVLKGILLDQQPRDNVISITTTKETYYAFLQLNPDPKYSAFQYSLCDIPDGVVTDIEFFDAEELGLCLQIDEDNSRIETLSINKMKFKTIATTKLITENPKIARSHALNKMRNTKIGCNGRPKRRIFSVVGSNGLIKILDMEDNQEEE
ncbi:anaphase-promoting complex, cyclosome, subunit 4-domain-containing protein [Mucor mucedo]|uniref:anaphase-promoting complex, cyclosome, subunit 4-domain-containing protein n=1 Tax=Mucor mucedo TaxID=29922 RepID=UPI0022202FB9|nr:anaphase-promoting complex, cyclosome, subunit 4-domain-containing protein [Mucor mucedo]KAI7893339.1 anaphase-promoting complex, cyclosome, subunit 4-domain-containing protein [Mucor mucedo]